MRAAKQPDPDDEPLDDAALADEGAAVAEETLDDWSEDEEAFAMDAETQGLVNKLYYPDENDEDEDEDEDL